MGMGDSVGIITPVCKVTTGTGSSRASQAQGTLRQRKDKQQHHPGTLRGRRQRNKSLYAHGRIIIARRWCVCHHYATGRAANLRHSRSIRQIPTCMTSAHPLASIYPIDFARSHTHTHTHERRGCNDEIVTTVSCLLPSVPSVFIYRRHGYLGHLVS